MLTLQELSDRAEISDIVARLGYTQDDKDFDGLAALFADRIGFDMPAAGGDPATDITRDELASLARTVLSGFTAPSTAPVTCQRPSMATSRTVAPWSMPGTPCRPTPASPTSIPPATTGCSGSSESTGDGSSRSGPS
jgi:hypothetical protein